MSERSNSSANRGIVSGLGLPTRRVVSHHPEVTQEPLIPKDIAVRKVEADPDDYSSEIELPRRGLRSRLLLLGILGATGLAAYAAKSVDDTIAKITDISFDSDDAKPTKFKYSHGKDDAPVDEEVDDHSYDDDKDKDVPSKVVDKKLLKDNGLSLPRKQALIMAQNLLSKGHLMSRSLNKLKRDKWAEMVIAEMVSIGIPLNKQNLMIATVTIDRESGFHETGIVNSPEKVLDRKIDEFKRENPHIYGLMEGNVPGLRARAIEFIKYRRAANLANGVSRITSDGLRVGYFTEKDLDLAIDYAIKFYESELSVVVKNLVTKESLDNYRPKTLGSMQLNVGKAIDLAKRMEGKNYSETEMRKTLNTQKGGLHFGMLYLREILAAHGKNNGAMNADDVKYVFLDFNMGAFTTRNAAIQSNLNHLGANLSVDGDLLKYDENGVETGSKSHSMQAICDVLRNNGVTLPDLQIKQDLLKEKSADFESTETYRQLKSIFASRGLTEKDVIPSVKAKGGFVKSGTNKITGTGYVNGSYRRYKDLENTLKK